MSATAVLYDAPGPRARALHRVFAAIALVGVLAAGWFVYTKFDDSGQWDAAKWKPFTEGNMWTNFLLPGIAGTLRAAAVAAVLAMAFGLVFGVGRMSSRRSVRWVSGTVVEFFRAVPLLIIMMFIYFAQSGVFGLDGNVYWAVVLGLMLYNGSVLAEVIRAGVNSLPKGQNEAALAVGLTPSQVMSTVLLPQAIRAMLPAVIAQMVVLLKDTALGYLLAYNELVNQLTKVDQNYHNLIPAAMVIALIYIGMNMSLGGLATWLEKQLSHSRRGKPAGVAEAADPLLSLPGAGMPGGGV
jgi:glutamate transport system permease protein